MLLQRLATGVKQAGKGQRGTRARMRSYTACLVPWHLLFNVRQCMVHPVPAYEFRRGFCTLVLFIVVAVIMRCSVPPPVRAAVTVMEYSVPSSRPVSVYIVGVPSTEVVFEPV